MKRYNNLDRSSYRGKKKRKKGLKILLIILAVIVVAAGIVFALNYNTIMLMTGHGTFDIKPVDKMKTAIDQTGLFERVEETSSAGESVLKTTSKDGAINLNITQSQSGTETISADINLKDIDTGGIDISALRSGDPSAIAEAKKLADKYVGTIIDEDSKTGIEAFLVQKLIKEFNSDDNLFYITQMFGSTELDFSGNMLTGQLYITIIK